MALGATIHKVQLHIADTDRQYYASHALTLARHPSETTKRLMVRLMAFSLHAHEGLTFTKGIADSDEPDLWLKDLTGAIDLWIEVGQPSLARLLKACGRAKQVVVYCYGGQASQVWWEALRDGVQRTRNLTVISVPPEAIESLAAEVQRNMTLHVNIQEQDLLVSGQAAVVTVSPVLWLDANQAL